MSYTGCLVIVTKYDKHRGKIGYGAYDTRIIFFQTNYIWNNSSLYCIYDCTRDTLAKIIHVMKNCIVNSFAYFWQLAEVLTMIFLVEILFCTYFIKSFSWLLSKNIMVSLFSHARCIWYFKHKNNWTIMNPNRKKHLAFHIVLLKLCILGAGYAQFRASHMFAEHL